MNNPVTLTVDELVAGLQSIAELKDKVFPVMTEEELIRISDVVPFPGLGVVYGGMVSKRDEKPSPGAVKSHMLVSLVLFYKVDAVFGPEVGAVYRGKATTLLDQIRSYMMSNPPTFGQTESYGLRPWQFLSERSPIQKKMITVWVQTWAVDLILT